MHGSNATVVPIDLTTPDGPKTLHTRTQEAGLAVDVLVNNAGFATHGVFETIPLQRQLEEITLNVAALVEVTHRFLPAMVARKNGAIINVSSTAAFQPVPYMAVYSASKAFVLSFSEALYEENRKRGITILALCPGSTETPFFDVVGAAEASFGRRATPEAVVATALGALDRRQSYAVDGLSNRLLAHLPRLLPRALAARISGNITRPRSAHTS
jgi:short-subunit dehydrogenase